MTGHRRKGSVGIGTRGRIEIAIRTAHLWLYNQTEWRFISRLARHSQPPLMWIASQYQQGPQLPWVRGNTFISRELQLHLFREQQLPTGDGQ